ncbi:helicase/SANT-associated, DNA binding protein [Actinidia rufa]|uniref:Helicase/SANT-associated, DNA binding protein n=1 Tax=Actinidia rufa TaxID=165716 RepID=A0A7J0GRM5_9ERIC|nr:helicase/SANT-associated, DNA binding protein [Actinidia rufa]
MHGFSLESAFLVNAEVDSMGGVIDDGVGFGNKTSLRRAAIEKAQAELRQEYDVREERRRELEFLEKGGNPLEFKFGNAAPVSVQSTSLIEQPPEQFVTSNSKPISQNSGMSPKALLPDTRSDAELDGARAVESTTGLTKGGLPEPVPDFNTFSSSQDKQHNQHSQADTRETSAMASGVPESLDGRKQVVSGWLECPPHASTAKAENKSSSGQLNGFSNAKGDRKSVSNERQSSNATFRTKCLDSEFSCTQNNLSLDGKNNTDLCNNFRNIDSNGNTKEHAIVFEGTLSMEGNEMLKNEKKSLDNYVFSNDEYNSFHQSPQGNGSIFGIKEELHGSGSGLQDGVKTSSETLELAGNTALKTERKPGDSLTENLDAPKENDFNGRPQGSLDSSIHDSSDPRRESAGGRLQSSMDPSILGLSGTAISVRASTGARKQQSSEIHSKLANKALEDSILEEARIIEAKRKRIAELSVGTLPLENRRKSHWDFVLEEMTWLANDFAQEKSKEPELQCPGKDFSHSVQGYAVRFLKYNTSLVPLGLAEAPATPDRTSDFGTLEMSWEDHFTEENLFYPVPPVSMETYRKSIESHLAQVEKIGCSIQEEVETSTFDTATEVSKPKKKKKPKHLGFTHEQRCLDNSFRNEQRDPSRKRLNNYQLESNGSSGLFSQHVMKKPKMMKQSLDCSIDNLIPITGAIPSPVASQMSNMSNPNKLTKILGGRERGRKSKSLKALVVLVHDMGPNWELISDAVNSTLQFKCIFHKPKDCKERHKILMDGTVGDGADSAEDSGSSQPYPSTLPGIPKALFFIFLLDAKPIQPHNSHALALSQVFPNNLNEGPPLTPLDLCDTTASNPEVRSLGYQGSQAGGFAISNQGTVASVLPASASAVNSSIQGSSNVALGNNFSSPSSLLNASVRDGRYGVPRSASLSIDEQQRMQQSNRMLSSRSIQQSAPSVSGAPPGIDHGVRILPGGNGVGIMSGLNRTMPMARPGPQGIAQPSMNSGSMISSSMAVMPSPVNVPSGVGSGQGNSVLRPRDALNMMRPGQNPEHQRQMMVPELQVQAGQGSNQGVPPFVGLTPGSQSAEKAEQVMQFMQGQGLYPGPGLHHVQQSKSSMPHSPNQSHPQQKMYSSQAIPSSKQVQQMSSNSDNSNPGNTAQATSGHMLPPSHQVVQPLVMTSANHQQLQPHQKFVNQTQAPIQRVFQENRQLTSDPQSMSQADQAQTDQQPVSNSPQISMTTAMPQLSIDSTSEIPAVSSSNAQWKAPEQASDSGVANPATQLTPIGSPPLTNSTGSEPMPTVSQGLGHIVGAQWQQQSQLQLPSTPPPPLPQQQQQSPQKQLAPQQQSQQQTQHLQAGNNSLSIRPYQL